MLKPTGRDFWRLLWATCALTVLAVAACSGESQDESSTTLASTTASSTAAAAMTTTPTSTTGSPGVASGPEIAAVLDFIVSYNAGDFEAVQNAIDPESLVGWTYEGELRSADEIFINANRRITVVAPCELASASVVTCTLVEVNDWHGAAGLTFEAVSRFHLNGELQIINWSDNWECCTAQIPFHWAFWEWFEVEHPDVYATVAPQTPDGLPGLRADPAHMTVAIAHVGEFLAQSDMYPIESSG